jgi:hypothetical protein
MVELNKKRRLEKKQGLKHSKIYQPFRAIGYVTNETPYVINNLGQTYLLTTSVGKSFQTYDVSKNNHLIWKVLIIHLVVGKNESFICQYTYRKAHYSHGLFQEAHVCSYR